MKFPSRVSRLVVVTSFVMVALTACGGVSRFASGVDDFGRAIGRNGDNLPQAPKNSSDDIPLTPLDLENQPPRVTVVEPISEKVVKAVIEDAAGRIVEVAVDCVTGEITPREAVDASQQGNIVETVCQQISQNGGAATSEVRTVNAGEGYANLRSSPSTETSTVAQVQNGTNVKIIEQKQNSAGQLWFKVSVNGQVGWIYSGLLD